MNTQGQHAQLAEKPLREMKLDASSPYMPCMGINVPSIALTTSRKWAILQNQFFTLFSSSAVVRKSMLLSKLLT